jgi:chemotaxis protein MotB
MAKEKGQEEAKRAPSRRRSKKSHGGHHGGAWKVAYADFVTAMMALFMVLWILSQGPEVKQAIASYFNDPRGLPIPMVNRSSMDNIGIGIMDHMPVSQPLGGGRGSGERFNEPLNPMNKEIQKLEEAGEKLVQEMMKQETLAGLTESISVEQTGEGLRIELIDKVEGTFFDIGSAQPREALRTALREINEVLRPLGNSVSIEGHTDARPFPNGATGYSNWELSADRGNTVRRLIIGMGFPEERINEVRAYAERMPLPGTNPLDGRNRRVSVFVKANLSAAAANPTQNQ